MQSIGRVAFSLALLFLLFGGATAARAQIDVDCPPEVIAALEVQFPGENRGTNPNDCQAWKHGFNPATVARSLARGPDPRCGFETAPIPQQGQIIFIEPKDAVCEPFSDGSCPLIVGGQGANDDPANHTVTFAAGRLDIGILTFISGQVISNEGARGFRMSCDSGPPTLVDPAECGGGQTAIVFDDGFTTGDAGVDPKADWQFLQNTLGDSITTGNAVCCDSPNNLTCGQVGNFEEYPGITRPLPDLFKNRPGAPPLIFTGSRGTAFDHSQTYTLPTQLYGTCATDSNIECNLTNLPDSDPCPSLGDVCNLAEEGYRVGTGDFLPDGSPNPGRCAHAKVRLVGNPVDPVTGRSTDCVLPTFFPAAVEGDPQPGCQVQNFGGYTRPDLDCDGVEDDTDNDGQPGPDLCPGVVEIDFFADANDDGIGDECQCADGSGDGAITNLDIGAVSLCANGVNVCDPTLIDATGDNATTAEDIGGVVAAVNGAISTADLKCVRNP